MADKEVVIRLTPKEFDVVRRALSEHDIKRSAEGLSTEECEALQRKLDEAK